MQGLGWGTGTAKTVGIWCPFVFNVINNGKEEGEDGNGKVGSAVRT